MPPKNRFANKVDLEFELADNNRPVFLYPCQIETRLFNRTLKVRIYPDQIAIFRLEKLLTKEEFLGGQRFHHAIKAIELYRRKLVKKYGEDRSAFLIEKTKANETYSGPEDEMTEQEFVDARAYHNIKSKPKKIWRSLVQKYGTHRAAWLIYSTKDIKKHQKEFRDPEATQEPQIKLLPSFFLVTLYPKNGDPLRKWCKVKSPLKVLSICEEGILGGGASWIADFEIAKKGGMAVEFQLSKEIDKILRITVVGINVADNDVNVLEELFENHHYTVGMGFPEFGTPTNNTTNTSAGYTKREDLESRFNQEFGDETNISDDCNAYQLAKALGFSDAGKALIAKWQYGLDIHNYYVEDLHRALWRVSGGYFFNYFIKGALDKATETKLMTHFKDFVRPAGMLPSFRIGNLPYGVLPVTQIKGWRSTSLDSKHLCNSALEADEWHKFDNRFHNVLMDFYERWREPISDSTRIPRVGDTQNQDAHLDEELIKILAMSANSRNYSLRPFVDNRLIGWFLDQMKSTLFDYLSKSQTPEESARKWVKTWRDLQKELAGFLKALGVNQNVIDSSQLMETIAWGDSKSLDIPLVLSKSNPNDNPNNYIPVLNTLGSKAPRNVSETLLYAMLHRALSYEADQKPWKLLKRDQAETEQKILEFFNNVKDPQEIVDRIIDDPQFRLTAPNRVYGVRPTLAETIFNKRNSLDGKQFTNIGQIDSIEGVGIDTLQDINYSFSTRIDDIDYESLLKGVFDSFTHRLDAWISSFASKRLTSMRRGTPKGIIIGAYGFVENLPIPNNGAEPDSLATGGYVHAPSVNQATTAALLKSGYLTHKLNENNPYRINLSSDRIRRASTILQGVREGQELGALLGYQFERDLHERGIDQYKDEFRKAFPLVALSETKNDDNVSSESVAARNVVNGLSLVKSSEDHTLKEKFLKSLSDEYDDTEAGEIAKNILGQAKVIESISLLREAMDGVADLLIHESVYQVVMDSYERSGAAMDASTGIGTSPELESITTPLESDDIGHRICILLNEPTDGFNKDQPREQVEPRLATWFRKLLGEMSEIGCCVDYHEKDSGNDALALKSDVVTLEQLNLGPLDFLYLSANRPGGGETELEQRIKAVLRARHENLVEHVIVGEDEVKQTPIKIDFGPYKINSDQPPTGLPYERCLDDAIEMAQQVLVTLSQAGALQPEKLCNPDKALQVGFSHEDYNSFESRAAEARDSLLEPMLTIQSYVEPLQYLERTELTYKNVKVIMASPGEILAHAGDLHQQISTAVEVVLLKNLENIDPTTKNALLTGIETIIANLIDQNPEKTPEELIGLASEDVLALVGKQLRTFLTIVFHRTLEVDGNIQPMFDETLAVIMNDNQDLLTGLSACVSYIKDQIEGALDQLFRFGILINQPKDLTADWLNGRVNAASERLQKANLHLGFAKGYHTQAQAEEQIEKEEEDGKAKEKMSQSIDEITRAIKALFGENFIVLPTFTLPESDKFTTYMDAQEKVLRSKPVSRIYLWLQQVAQTHIGSQRLEDMLLLMEAWYGSEIFKPTVIQQPYQIEKNNLKDSLGWQALSDDELGIAVDPNAGLEEREIAIREKRPRGTMSIALFGEGPITTSKVCGVIVDQWTEPLPHGTVDTAIALHADTPNQQPPNCCLLAVPGQRKQNGHWTPKELEAIVYDTLDLAKIRSVDLDALPDLKGLLPALFLPISPEQDFFEGAPILKPIKEIESLGPV